jgi:hypothetical protein
MTQSPYRDRLTRGSGPRAVLWIGVNPSTAEDLQLGQPAQNDQTVTKIEGFTDRYFPGDRIYLANKFARRATDVRELRSLTIEEAIGPDCDVHLCGMLAAATSVVFAWGPLAKLPPHLRERWRQVDAFARALDHQPLCLGVCKDGQPRHPLMVGYDVAPRPWERPA